MREVLVAQLPDYAVRSVVELGQGLENVAYVVNDQLIVRLSKATDTVERAAATRREARVLAVAASASPLPVPHVRFAAPERGCLAYDKLPGVPFKVLPSQARAAYAVGVGAELGHLLRALHGLPTAALAGVVGTDADPPTQWLREAAGLLPDISSHLSAPQRPRVAAFFAALPPSADAQPLVFSHNDLGAEHVLVEPSTGRVTGIIDWTDAALVDPAYDFGLVHRDLGPPALDAALAAYRSGRLPALAAMGLQTAADAAALRARAVFYARCSVFEDLAYAIHACQPAAIEASLTTLEWLFPG